jgi:hypothetical protein
LGNLLFGDRNPVPVDPPTRLVFQNTTRVRLDLVPLEVEVSEVQDQAIVTLQDRRHVGVEESSDLPVGRRDGADTRWSSRAAHHATTAIRPALTGAHRATD